MSNVNSDEEMEQDFSPLSALGLQRVGEKRPPPSKETKINLNRRGMPVRIGKKNKIYFDEDLVTSPVQSRSPKKSSKITPKKLSIPPVIVSPYLAPSISRLKLSPKELPKSTVTTVAEDKKIAQNNGSRLRNFLKLPQAHKWVYYEWFYSNIDKTLFEGENDFQIVLKEAFPNLATRVMTRRQWGLVRKMMGKPRRCSQAFFSEERQSLCKRRQVLRLLQQRKITDLSMLKDIPIPNEIPLSLTVGTKITARLRRPENGLFNGVVDAVDTLTDTYRISFDRTVLGTHSIPDYEVGSNCTPEVIALSTLSEIFRPNISAHHHAALVTPPKIQRTNSLTNSLTRTFSNSARFASPSFLAETLNGDPLLAQSPIKPSSLSLDGSIGTYPIKSLLQIVKLSKILKLKNEKIDRLKELNCQAEKIRSFGDEMNFDFQRKYAGLILEMEKMNRDLNQTLVEVQQFCQEIAPNSGISGPTLLPRQIKDRCYQEAAAIVDVTNNSSGDAQVSSQPILELINKLTSIMLQLKNMTESEVSAFELTSLQETVNEIKGNLLESSKPAFENNVEIHLSHIMSSISQMGTLQAFTS